MELTNWRKAGGNMLITQWNGIVKPKYKEDVQNMQ